MSNRTLIEINHDYARELRTPDFLDALGLYVNSAGPEEVKALERFGIRVFGMRHHSDAFTLKWGTHARIIAEADSTVSKGRSRWRNDRSTP